jgi:translation initiation factor eIF-2B subunit beta
MWDGGIICKAGGQLLALAAKNFSVPFLVVTGVFKLSLEYAFDQSTFNELYPPNEVFEPKNGDLIENIEVYLPKFNYVQPQYISLFVTDHGKYTSAYIYRLFEDYYLLSSDEGKQ